MRAANPARRWAPALSRAREHVGVADRVRRERPRSKVHGDPCRAKARTALLAPWARYPFNAAAALPAPPGRPCASFHPEQEHHGHARRDREQEKNNL